MPIIILLFRDIKNDTSYYITLHNTDVTKSVNVSLTFYESACLYYDTNSSVWNTSGCTPNPKSNQNITVCDCNHMTMFGASVQYRPVIIDFKDITVCIFFLTVLYCSAGIFTNCDILSNII